jgi:hypothetical protein
VRAGGAPHSHPAASQGRLSLGRLGGGGKIFLKKIGSQFKTKKKKKKEKKKTHSPRIDPAGGAKPNAISSDSADMSRV